MGALATLAAPAALAIVHGRLYDELASRVRLSGESGNILEENGVFVIPDILANAGGVTASYFEWVQDLGRLFWDRREIRAKLRDVFLA